MSAPRFASLGPTLLARKGGARPAMRPQLAPLMADAAQIAALADEQLDDLGWNDMGETEAVDASAVMPSQAAAADPAASSRHARGQQPDLDARAPLDTAPTGRKDATGNIGKAGKDRAAAPQAAPEAHAPVSPHSAARRAPAAGRARRTAFTLRLDRERHFRLRLAAMIQGVSAQALVTEALDALLAQFDELDTIAAHLRRRSEPITAMRQEQRGT
jgi:hypothetical protein